MQQLARFTRDEDGQDVVEYGLLIATVGLVVLASITAFGSQINGWFGTLSTKITSQTGS